MIRIPLLLAGLVASVAVACTDSLPMAPSNSLTPSNTSIPDVRSVATPTPMVTVKGGRPATTGVVYVTSQGLYYDTFVTNDPLPMEGKFQLLENGETEFGPGQPGYLGGRWWEDLNGNGVQDEGDHFFHCPLLPPGRPTP
jgi:hypothetical protein